MDDATEIPFETAADAVLNALAAQGVDYFFANPGTDFPSIVEGFAKAAESNRAVPRPMVITHENAAVAMAYGVYLVTGKAQAVMVHVSPGTANTVLGLMDSARDRVPILLLAGRTPASEQGAHGSRSSSIHWQQEMYDQAGMVREFVKWEYELRRPEQAEDTIGRALQIARSSPQGPVYLQLPREVLAAPVPEGKGPVTDPATRRASADAPYPSPAAMAKLGDWIAAAERPIIITAGAGKNPAETPLLARIADRFALPVVGVGSRFVALPASHKMHQGYVVGPLLKDTDLVIVLDCDVPWIPGNEAPPANARVVHIGEDPNSSNIPFRSFPSDLSITATNLAALTELERVLEARISPDDAKIVQRRNRFAERSDKLRAQWLADAEKAGEADTISPAWLSHCIRQAVPDDAAIVNEYTLQRPYCPFETPGTWFGSTSIGGLGIGLGVALGVKLASPPDRLVVATVGDGSYMFANPAACHWVAEAHDLPILTIIFNNSIYGAVRSATLGMYKEGAAARGKGLMLANLGRGTAYEKYAEASGGVGFRVEDPKALPGVLAQAVDIVMREKRQVVVNAIIPPPQ